jgi:hypothetical protein
VVTPSGTLAGLRLGPASLVRLAARRSWSVWTAALLFFGLALVVTWPLLPGLGRDIPKDYGDPLYAAWAMAWVMRQMGRALGGHANAITGFWDANQLHPEPATLALSDHFIAQALPLAPVYWLTGNAALTLGLAYIVAFTLCGFCAWLLVREITGSGAAGVLAGVVLAYNEFFLLYELAHLQVLSVQWMPLTLFGLRRYFARGERAALVGASFGLVMLNLSAGYYLLMFPPFLALYALWEVTARRRWRDLPMWRDLGAAAGVTALVTAPFVWPYVLAQQRFGFERSVVETAAMAATVDGYVASFDRLRWAWLCAALAAAAPVAQWVMRRRTPALPLTGFALTAALLAGWLSLGPAPVWHGETFPSLGLYGWLRDLVPGMDAIRVSGRFAAVFLVFLSLLAGLGAALVSKVPRGGRAVVLVLAALTVAANRPVPFPLNGESPPVGVHAPAPYLTPGPTPPAVYRYLASLPPGRVVAELPFWELWHNTRYLYFSTFHWHRLLNGFTSFFPPGFEERVRWLNDPVRTPDEAWQALTSAGTTHVVVHTGAWDDEYGRRLDEWLSARGAKLHGRFDLAEVYELPR